MLSVWHHRQVTKSIEPESFQSVMNRLLEWMGPSLPPYSSIAVTELPEESPGAERSAPVPASEFVERFQAILQVGCRDWVNVGIEEVRDGVLYVEVTYCTNMLPGRAHQPAETISVNLHGPTRDACNRMGMPTD